MLGGRVRSFHRLLFFYNIFSLPKTKENVGTMQYSRISMEMDDDGACRQAMEKMNWT